MIIGIDLGTTNSLVACWRDGAPIVIPNSLGENLTPSCIGLSDRGDILVGQAARERLRTHAHLTTSNFKRYMGTNRSIRLGKQEFRPEELSSFVLRGLKADAEAHLGHPVEEAVISVPAYFSDAQRKATQAAARLAGLRAERLINEPTAAALAHGVRANGEESQFLVFDLGGGTFDVSILEMFDGVMEVRASAGDNFLGGEDFVDAIVAHFFATAAKDAGVTPEKLSREQEQRLRHAVERLKRQLSSRPEASFSVTFKDREIEYCLDEAGLEAIAAGLLSRLRQPLERALRDARIRVSDLDQILLAGGATRMPIVRKLVARMFGRFPACHLDPDEVVALGAAVQAGLKMGDAALDETVMTDVCPYSLGIEVSQQIGPKATDLIGGQFLPIIDRNTVVPVSRSQDISTITDWQQVIAIKVFQGEARLVKDNIPLGAFEVPVPRKPAGQAGANIRFTYDVNGILEVEAVVHETDASHRIVIQENPGVLSNEEIERRLTELARLKLHPRDDSRNIALLTRADRLFEECTGPVRQELSQAVAQFQAILNRQDAHEIAEARERMTALLNAIEPGGIFD